VIELKTGEFKPEYAGFFTLYSIGFLRDERPGGKRRMQQTWGIS